MRILKIYDGDYPWDVRVEKVTDTLLEAGHEVRMLCRNRAGLKRRERLDGGLDLARLPALPGPLTFPAFVNPIWAASLAAQIRRFHPERLLVRDLPLAPLVVAIGRMTGIPVIADLAEPYPESLRSQRQFEPLSLLDRLVRNPRAAEKVERYVVRRCARVLVVCPEAGQRLLPHGLSDGDWVEVGNTPRLDQFAPSGASPRELEGLGDRFVLFFGGLLAGDRGLDVAIDAVAELEERRPGRFALIIVGDGPLRPSLEAQCQRLGLGDAVRLTGYIEHGRLPDLIDHADAGLLPFHTCPHIDHTLANKLFEYMSLGLPVIISNIPPMLRILREYQAGVSFESGNSADLARAIELLERDPASLRRYGEKGREAVSIRYNWGVDAERLVSAVQEA